MLAEPPVPEPDTVVEGPGGPDLVPVLQAEGRGLRESDSEPDSVPEVEADWVGTAESVASADVLALPVPDLVVLAVSEDTGDTVTAIVVVTEEVPATEADFAAVADGDPEELHVSGAVRDGFRDAVSLGVVDTDTVSVPAADAVGASDCDTVLQAVEVATTEAVCVVERVAQEVPVATEGEGAAVAELAAEREGAEEAVPLAEADTDKEGAPLAVLHADVVPLPLGENSATVGDTELDRDVEGDAVVKGDGEELRLSMVAEGTPLPEPAVEVEEEGVAE